MSCHGPINRMPAPIAGATTGTRMKIIMMKDIALAIARLQNHDVVGARWIRGCIATGNHAKRVGLAGLDQLRCRKDFFRCKQVDRTYRVIGTKARDRYTVGIGVSRDGEKEGDDCNGQVLRFHVHVPRDESGKVCYPSRPMKTRRPISQPYPLRKSYQVSWDQRRDFRLCRLLCFGSDSDRFSTNTPTSIPYSLIVIFFVCLNVLLRLTKSPNNFACAVSTTNRASLRNTLAASSRKPRIKGAGFCNGISLPKGRLLAAQSTDAEARGSCPASQ